MHALEQLALDQIGTRGGRLPPGQRQRIDPGPRTGDEGQGIAAQGLRLTEGSP